MVVMVQLNQRIALVVAVVEVLVLVSMPQQLLAATVVQVQKSTRSLAAVHSKRVAVVVAVSLLEPLELAPMAVAMVGRAQQERAHQITPLAVVAAVVPQQTAMVATAALESSM